MSLINLLHQSVVIKFFETARDRFDPEASHVFRLTGVDAMGFLQVQELNPAGPSGSEATSEPYWINKDLVREIHEFGLAKMQESQDKSRETTSRPQKSKLPGKPKPMSKPKLSLS